MITVTIIDMNTKSKYSRQREEILKVLQGTKSHPTADWVYSKLKNKIPKLSLGTVYRNLNLLREQGEIIELSFGSTFDRFDGNPLPHYHFVCQLCGRVMDIDLPVADELNRRAEKLSGFKINSHRLEFFGCCNDCTKREGVKK